MKRRNYAFLIMWLLCCMTVRALSVDGLRTQSLANPVGIDAEKPVFSWRLHSEQRGIMQKSYEILVASDSDFQNIVWNSGIVESDRSVHVPYGGGPLKPSTRYYWRVTVNDNKGNTATSSETAYFETGLMDSGWSGAQWIMLDDGDAEEANDIGEYTIEATFEIKDIAAGIIFAMQDESHYYMWQFNVEKSNPRFRPHRWNGNAACLEDKDLTGVHDLQSGKECRLRIEISDNATMARTYLDNILVDERSGDYKYGRLGMRQDKAESSDRLEAAYFDNIKVTVAGKVVFEEDFTQGNSSFEGGEVKNGRLLVTGKVHVWQKPPQSGSDKLHYTIETDMTLLRDNAGIVFSHSSATKYMMWAVNTCNLEIPVVRRHVYNGSTTPSYSDTQIKGFSKEDLLGKSRNLKLEVKGNVVMTFIDGILVDEFVDKSNILKLGNVGFRVSHTSAEDEQAYFDNLKVTSYNEDGTSEIVMWEDFEQEFSAYFDNLNIKKVNGNGVAYIYSDNGEKKFMQNSTKGEPMFRKTFAAKGKVLSAKLYTTALGIYDVWMNGKRVGHLLSDGTMKYEELKPGWTDYSKKVFYDTHDVTSLIVDGENAIGATVSSGWWNGAIAHGEYGDHPLGFMAKLVMTYDDGSSETIVTDNSWLCSTSGALRRGDIYDGESYDARLATDWTSSDVSVGEWNKVGINTSFKGTVTAFEGPAVEVRKEFEREPTHITVYQGTNPTGTEYGMVNVVGEYTSPAPVKLKKGQTVIYDFGQNAVGWVRFTAKGNAGNRLRFRFSEMLNDKGDSGRGDDGPGGSLYLINLRGAAATLYYVMSGKQDGETFQPSTTFFGFRYCEVTATNDVEISDIKAQVVGSVLTEGSMLRTSHEAVNQLYSNVQWGQRSNFVSIPTDCPQRDERLGWTADTQIFSRAATYNADCAAFYHKWMGDMRDSQRADGAYPDVAPHAWVGYGNGAWGDAGIVLPWNVYLMYGDISMIEENYASMEKYMDWLERQAGNGYKYQGAGTAYGDWVSFVHTDSRYVSVCYYAYDAQLMAKMSRALSKAPGDEYALKAMKYEQLFENIKAEFATRYLSGGMPVQRTQTGCLLALKFNLLPDEASVRKTVTLLDKLIGNNMNTLNTGFVGTGILNQTLTEVGLADRAYNLLLQRRCPSWLYSVDQGATTIWERWDSYTKDKGFHPDITMNSFNHYAYGAVAEWMYRFMAGIEADEDVPGFKHIVFKPVPDDRKELPNGQERITEVDATYCSDYGNVGSSWKREADGSISLSVTVPANTTATLYYPLYSEDAKVKENGTDAEKAEGIEFVGIEDAKAVYRLGSGSYHFSTDIASGVGEVETSNVNMNLYPNPVVDYLHVACDADISDARLFDCAGSAVKSFEGDMKKLDMTDVRPGMYMLALYTDKGKKTSKVIKK